MLDGSACSESDLLEEELPLKKEVSEKEKNIICTKDLVMDSKLYLSNVILLVGNIALSCFHGAWATVGNNQIGQILTV